MSIKYEVALDKSGRITHFSPKSSDYLITPEEIGNNLDGDERVLLGGVEYNLTREGNLIHPTVSGLENAFLGYGVKLGPETQMLSPTYDDPHFNPEKLNKIEIGDRTRVEGTVLANNVSLGRYGIILAQFIGNGTSVGDYCRLAEGVEIGAWSDIGDSVKIDRDSNLGSQVHAENAVRLGYKTIVGNCVRIGHNSQIGKFIGCGAPRSSVGGVRIPSNTQLEPKTRM